MMDCRNRWKVLLVGRRHELAWTLPALLSRAGFSVDVISSSAVMGKSRFVHDLLLVPQEQSLIPAIRQKLTMQYDWIVITEDGSLAEILYSNLSVEEKLILLPVMEKENFLHLCSKIFLSKIFAAKGIQTPPFRVVENRGEALMRAEELGYPILLKEDYSSGGAGVYEYKSASEIPVFQRSRKLLQKKIIGREMDLSALYLEGDLVYFSFSKLEERLSHAFSPSSVRSYRLHSQASEEIFKELTQIGKALGLHGFSNLSCMESEGERFYFETDARPNAWVMFPKFLGEDPAIYIHDWFASRKTLSFSFQNTPQKLREERIPYFLRLSRKELLQNRYRVWRYIPWDDPGLTARLLWKKFFTNLSF